MPQYSERVSTFAKALHAALKREHWGDIDPWWIELIGERAPEEELGQELSRNVDSLAQAFEKALVAVDQKP